MWNNVNTFRALADMPPKLSEKNLEFLQSEIDKDKLAAGSEMNRDLCGAYAPFCAFCDKKTKYPCAVALVKYKQNDGLQLEIVATDYETAPVYEQSEKEESIETQDEVTEPAEEALSLQTEPDGAAECIEEVQTETKPQRIRIAIAKRKRTE